MNENKEKSNVRTLSSFSRLWSTFCGLCHCFRCQRRQTNVSLPKSNIISLTNMVATCSHFSQIDNVIVVYCTAFLLLVQRQANQTLCPAFSFYPTYLKSTNLWGGGGIS